MQETHQKTIKSKPTAPQGWGPGRPGPGPGSPAQTGGAASLRFIVFSMGFLHFGYAYALIGLEINIRLDLISNVCINNPDYRIHRKYYVKTKELLQVRVFQISVLPRLDFLFPRTSCPGWVCRAELCFAQWSLTLLSTVPALGKSELTTHGYTHGYVHGYIHGYVHGYIHGYMQLV